jgi:hypothetical protein
VREKLAQGWLRRDYPAAVRGGGNSTLDKSNNRAVIINSFLTIELNFNNDSMSPSPTHWLLALRRA